MEDLLEELTDIHESIHLLRQVECAQPENKAQTAQSRSVSLQCRTAALALDALPRMYQFSMLVDLMASVEPRRRRDMRRDVSASYERVLQLPDRLFFEQTRMDKSTFFYLCKIVEPYFYRHPSTRGPTPAPFLYLLLYTLRVCAQGVHSWAAMSVDWDVGKSTLMQVWVPKTCVILSLALPIDQRPRENDEQGWNERSSGFEALCKLRVSADAASRTAWRAKLPAVWDAFLPIGEVCDGVITPLASKPKGLGARVQEYRHHKSNAYALNNLIGVDSAGRITTAILGAPASVSDSTLFEHTQLFKAMEHLDPAVYGRGMPEGYCVIADSGFTQRSWVMTPFSRTNLIRGPNRVRCRLYNFRLSQIRVISENCFGRLKARWTILKKIPYGPEIGSVIVQACCGLHNFLEGRGEPVLLSWLRQLNERDVEPTGVACSYSTLASLHEIPAGVKRRIEVASRLGLGWEEQN